jgi:hypothetical protein
MVALAAPTSYRLATWAVILAGVNGGNALASKEAVQVLQSILRVMF